MENTLIFSSDEEVRFGKLLKYIIPTYLTSLFNTVYTIIDGIFVSAYVGTDALAAINIVYPLVNVLTGIALAFATGGSAVAALHIGGGRKDRADRSFSCSIAASILLGSSVSLIIILNLSKILTLLGATDLTMVDCKIYALWWLWAAPVFVGKELFTCIQFCNSIVWRCSEYYFRLYPGRANANGNPWGCTCNDLGADLVILHGCLLFLPQKQVPFCYLVWPIHTGCTILHGEWCI